MANDNQIQTAFDLDDSKMERLKTAFGSRLSLDRDATADEIIDLLKRQAREIVLREEERIHVATNPFVRGEF